MSKIIAIDFGAKRTGIAETDDLQMMAFGLTAVDTPKLLGFLEKYFKDNQVDTVVIGESRDLQGNFNPIEENILKFIHKFQKMFPDISIARQDETYTSKMAERSILQMGKKKKDRQNKYLVDEVSATLILQSFLEKKEL